MLTYRTGYDCLDVASAQEVLDALAEERFDLIVCGIAGWDDEAFQRLTTRFEVPVVICTARQDPAVYLRFRKMGAREILPKPFSRDQLLKIVRKTLGEKPNSNGLLPV